VSRSRKARQARHAVPANRGAPQAGGRALPTSSTAVTRPAPASSCTARGMDCAHCRRVCVSPAFGSHTCRGPTAPVSLSRARPLACFSQATRQCRRGQQLARMRNASLPVRSPCRPCLPLHILDLPKLDLTASHALGCARAALQACHNDCDPHHTSGRAQGGAHSPLWRACSRQGSAGAARAPHPRHRRPQRHPRRPARARAGAPASAPRSARPWPLSAPSAWPGRAGWRRPAHAAAAPTRSTRPPGPGRGAAARAALSGRCPRGRALPAPGRRRRGRAASAASARARRSRKQGAVLQHSHACKAHTSPALTGVP